MIRFSIFFAAIALLVFQFLKPTFEYLEVDGARERYNQAKADSYREQIDDRFLLSCAVVPGPYEQKKRYCDQFWEKVGFELPVKGIDDEASGQCAIESVYRLLDKEHLLHSKPTLAEVSEALPCKPRYLGKVETYAETVRVEETLFLIREITRIAPNRAGPLYAYSVGTGPSTRYLWFRDQKLGGTIERRFDEMMGWVEDLNSESAARRRALPETVPTNNALFTKAIIALGRANATGCGSFRVDWDGNAVCEDGGRWKIDFFALKAYEK